MWNTNAIEEQWGGGRWREEEMDAEESGAQGLMWMDEEDVMIKWAVVATAHHLEDIHPREHERPGGKMVPYPMIW